jgi:PAS domain S-box-containing protein
LERLVATKHSKSRKPLIGALSFVFFGLGLAVFILLKLSSTLPMVGVLSIFSVVALAAVGTATWAAGQSNRAKISDLEAELVGARSNLNREEVRSEALLENAVDGIVSINARGKILSANAATGTLFGYSSGDLIGQNIKILAGGIDRPRHDAYLKHYILTGENHIIGRPREVLGQRADGSTFPVDLSVARMEMDGEALFIGVLRDITKRVALEDQLRHAQKLEAVGQLTGGIAHDFNNLLAIVQGNLSLLQMDLDDTGDFNKSEAINLCAEALEASLRGAELTKGLLAYSRKQKLNPKQFDANEAVEGMEGLLRRTIGEGIDLKIATKEGGWQVMADRPQLESAVLNMAVNARDALNHEGMLTLETSDVTLDEAYAASHEEVRAGDYVLIAVSDNGPGMSEDVLARALEPFFTTKEVGEGSGLGLSMIYGFAKQSEGHLSIYSEPGVGTTVKLYLPRSGGAEKETTLFDNTSGAAAMSGHERILVVEDDDALRRTVTRILERSGYDVVVAADGQEALQLLAQTPQLDLLLTDVVLPGGMNGPSLVEAAETNLGPIKVLYMSGYTKEAVMHRGQLSEDTHLIHKPFSPQDLGSAIRTVLEER